MENWKDLVSPPPCTQSSCKGMLPGLGNAGGGEQALTLGQYASQEASVFPFRAYTLFRHHDLRLRGGSRATLPTGPCEYKKVGPNGGTQEGVFSPWRPRTGSCKMSEVEFVWKSGTPSEVVVTGDFDEWKCSHKLEKRGDEFRGVVPVKFTAPKVYFKFVVDGEWVASGDYKRESNDLGSENNYITKEDARMGSMDASMDAAPKGTAPMSSSTDGLQSTTTHELTSEVESQVKGSGEQRKKFKIKRVVKTNKKTGEREVVSQEVIALDENDQPITESMENTPTAEPMMEDAKADTMEENKKEEKMAAPMAAEEKMNGDSVKKSEPMKSENKPMAEQKKPMANGKPMTNSTKNGKQPEKKSFMKKVKTFFAPRQSL